MRRNVVSAACCLPAVRPTRTSAIEDGFDVIEDPKAPPAVSRELDILEYMVRRTGRTVTRSMLLQDVWGYRFEPRSNVVDVHMSKLRRKVDKPDDEPLIRNIHGEGYRIDGPR